MCDTNYIYLLQEREFVNAKQNIYKVGRTTKPNLKRFNQYPKESVLLYHTICYDCKIIERQVIKQFKENFKLRKDIGNEYFEGNYKIMIDIIYLTIKNEICVIKDNDMDEFNSTDDLDKTDDLKFKILCEKICDTFPDYKNDESFGGLNKYIKINFIDNEYIVYYIDHDIKANLHYYYDDKCEEIFNEYIINKNVADKLQYFNYLISKKIIVINEIYDINSNNFIDKIIKTKFNITIENFEAF